jgi:hypothetical protein
MALRAQSRQCGCSRRVPDVLDRCRSAADGSPQMQASSGLKPPPFSRGRPAAGAATH